MVASKKIVAFWDIALMMEAVCTSETSVYYNETTRRSIPEGYHLHSNETSGFIKAGHFLD
jgi:hypothetical protein